MNSSEEASASDGRVQNPAVVSLSRRVRSALALVQVRLRIPIVLVIAAVVIGRWDVIRNYWDRLTRPNASESTADRAVSADTEYFCPMDPGVVSDWPGKCGACNMALVRRKRGEAVMLPDGVVARMQLSPYRVQLAGIRTAPAAFLPLLRQIESSGVVARSQSSATVLLKLPARQAPWVVEGTLAEVTCAELPGQEGLSGQVKTLGHETTGGWEYLRATIAIADPPPELRTGMVAVVRVRTPMAALDPFCDLPAGPPPLTTGEAWRVYVCPEHFDSIGLLPGRCPIDQTEREPRSLGENQRLRWWCPMHPRVTADKAGSVCTECGGMSLAPRLISYNPRGQVLAVPEAAVVDTGAQKVVFVETMPGMFDGIEVVLGPRCGDYYPVVKGLEVGQKVAIAGAFLLDAETRLNPSLAAGYFGAGRGQRAASPEARATEPKSDRAAAALRSLSAADRRLAEQQKVCPVTNKPLGSMGTPTRAIVSGRVVFLCCEGCENALQHEPAKYLAKVTGLGSP